MMMQDALPGIKRYLAPAKLGLVPAGFLIRLMTGFICHLGRMSASQAAEAVRSDSRHRAAIVRFLAKCGWSGDWCVLAQLAEVVLQAESSKKGTWLFLIDSTLMSHQGKKMDNTYSCGNRKRRPRQGRRYNKNKHTRKSCHAFVMGLLITPSGIRIPSCRCYFTKEYCKRKNRPQRTQTELAAELITALVVPAKVELVVLGDTSFDAKCIRDACAARGFDWIVPVNPERVLAGPKKQRPKVTSLVQEMSADHFAPLRLTPDQGAFVAQRRMARCRRGSKTKSRTWYVHEERRAVHSVGEVQLVFSMKEPPKTGTKVSVDKILMTNSRRSAAEVVELYLLRWQIELFFKELKSTLGIDEYRFLSFDKVEAWVAACLLTFLYLEWHRTKMLQDPHLSAKDKEWWRSQRTHGLCVAIRQQAEEAELKRLGDYTHTRTGMKKLKRLLRQARPLEYRRPTRKAS